MSKQKPDKPTKVEANKDRAISFRAPEEIHGALKQIAGRMEMKKVKIDGRVPFERDILNWLVSELYMKGQDKWAESLNQANNDFKDLISAESD